MRANARRLFALALGVVLAALPAQAGGLETIRFEQDGQARRALLYVPDGLAESPAPVPLVLAIHGGGGIDRNMRWLTRRRFEALADAHGFALAYPNAIDRMWDFGEGNVSEALTPRRDDLGYFARVIDAVAARVPLDRARIFATGISRGGRASYFLACKLPAGTIRAIAPVTMPLPEYFQDDCRAGPPVGIIVINGTDDPLAPYDGGSVSLTDDDRDPVISTEATMALWRARNGCAGASAASRIDRVEDGTAILRTDWDCAGASTALLKVDGGGHTWPGGRRYLPERFVGKTSREIDAAEVIWRFFASFN